MITGTPGVGKSSISKLLASKIDAQVISISELVKKEKLYCGIDKKRDTLIADMKKISRRIRNLISNFSESQNIIIEGHFATDIVPPEKVSLVFVLRKDPEELRKILEKRFYKERKIKENLAAEILDVCLYDAVKRCGVDKVCEIDTTSKSLKEIVQEMIEVLNGVKECKVGIVDWLSKIESEGKLEEYLSDF